MPALGTLKRYDPILTNHSLAFRNEATAYVATKMFPPFPTQGGLEHGSAYRMDPKNMLTAPGMAHRADGAESHEVRWTFTEIAFLCQAWAYHTYNTPRQKRNVQGPLSLDMEDAELLTELLLLEKELRMKTLVAGLTPDVNLGTVTRQWNTATAAPRSEISTAMQTVYKKTGKRANVMFIAADVFADIRTNSTAATAGAQIQEAIKYSTQAGTGVINAQLLAQFFDIDQVIVMEALYNPVNEGQTQANAYIWSDYVLVAHIESTPRLKTPTWGWTMEAERMNTRRWIAPERDNANVIEVQEITDEFQVCRDAVYVISNVLS